MWTLFVVKTRLLDAYKKLVRREEGASLVEYGLLVGLIAIVCIASITLLGTNIASLFNKIAGKLAGLGT